MTAPLPPRNETTGAGLIHTASWREALTPARALRVLLLLLVAVGLALLGAPHVTRPLGRYAAGEFAPHAIRAPFDISVTDEEATRQQRGEAARRAPVVATFDPGVPAAVLARFREALAPIGPLARELSALRAEPTPTPRTRAARAAAQARVERRRALERDLEAALAEAERALGEALPQDVRTALREPGGAPSAVDAFGTLVAAAYASPVVPDVAGLQRLADGATRPLAVVLVEAASGSETRLDDVDALRDVGAARLAVEAAGRTLPTQALARWLTPIAVRWVRPNALPDVAATAARRDAAAASVLPVSLTFRRNQLIVGEGQPVTRQALLVLDAIASQRLDRTTWQRLLGRGGVLFALLLLAFVVVDRDHLRFALETRHFPYAVTSLGGTAVAFRVWIESLASLAERYPALPEAALVLMFPAAATFMHARVVLPYASAVTYLAVQSICLGLLWQIDLLFVVYQLVAGLVAGHLAAECSRRQCVVRAGLLAGVALAPVAACLALLTGEASAGTVAWTVAGALAGCALSGLTLLAVGPLFEWLFGHMTRIRLVELMNYEHPLLRRLTETTPGTFQHSVTIGLLADAAAQAVDADGLLARVGALYHDVGKTERPELFVENQHGANPHDTLAPAESARLIIGHVDAGVRLVEEHGVGERIADFVREHHGTSLVRYFLARAEAQGPADPAAFRYPGPRPRSRETGILMIADQVEATARAMDDPTEEGLREMAQRTIDRVQAEGQLDECPLTMRELALIREAFVQVLVGAHHRRIKYPRQEIGNRK